VGKTVSPATVISVGKFYYRAGRNFLEDKYLGQLKKNPKWIHDENNYKAGMILRSLRTGS
jgi:hypothetical protein